MVHAPVPAGTHLESLNLLFNCVIVHGKCNVLLFKGLHCRLVDRGDLKIERPRPCLPPQEIPALCIMKLFLCVNEGSKERKAQLGKMFAGQAHSA